MQRRNFVKSTAAAGAGWIILKSGTLRGQNAPSNKLNAALIGVWGRGTAHYDTLRDQNVVALCDVNEVRLGEGVQIFPGAKTYMDWRRLLDQKDIEAVIIAVPDHHHALIANWALNRGMHVYCEKPLGIGVEEVRTVRANYMKQKAKLATQHGTQRHAYPNYQRVRELILDGAIGELKSASCWDSRVLPRPGYPAGDTQPPSILSWDQWIGPSRYHPYSPLYFGGRNGYNCVFWNMYSDFGVGQIGDMAAHTMDLVWSVIDGTAPTAVEADMDASEKYNSDISPVKLKVSFDLPKNSWRGPIRVEWYQGGVKPLSPRLGVDVAGIANGAIFEGTKGFVVADYTSRMILPNNDDGDMTYFRRRTTGQLLPLVGGVGTPSPQQRPVTPEQAAAASQIANSAAPDAAARWASALEAATIGQDGFPVVKPLPNGFPPALGLPNPGLKPPQRTRRDPFQTEWIEACKGNRNTFVSGTSSKTHCDFDYAGEMMEMLLLGLVSHRVGKKIQYDAAAGRITNAPEANDYLKRTYRPGWTLNG